MLNSIALLTDTVIPVLRSTPELVATTSDDPLRIYAYIHSYPESVESLFQVIQRQLTPSILVAHRGTSLTGRGNGIEHTYSVFLKPYGDVGAMFLALRDGIPAQVMSAGGLVAGPGSKLKLTQIHYKCHPPAITALTMQSMLIAEQQFIDYYESPLVLTERGLDT